MSKCYVFFNDIPPLKSRTVLPDVYCPTGGYHDKNLAKTFSSKGEKFRYLRSHGMREAELTNPDKGIGGTDGSNINRRGPNGNFAARPMATWMKQELGRMAHV